MALISVVMATYNDAETLPITVDSILAQRDVELEFIIVDDGSTDETSAYLHDAAARDDRIRVLTQANAGLTSALILGCAAARGHYIARQDAGDRSRPSRLAQQLELLERSEDAVMCSCYAEFRGPAGEFLYIAQVDESDIANNRALADYTGPSHHGAVMMRNSAYKAAGGYRRAFYFAQDIDLWSRLEELGQHRVIPEVLYQARLTPDALSGLYVNEQKRSLDCILQAARARRAGRDEAPFLDLASRVRPRPGDKGRKRRTAAGAYFIGSCLLRRDPAAARRYLLHSIRDYPLGWKAWLRLGSSFYVQAKNAAVN